MTRRPASTSSTTWTEKVDNAVSPPRKPTPIASRSSPVSHSSAASSEQERTGDVDARPQETLVVEGEPRAPEAREDAEEASRGHEEGGHGQPATGPSPASAATRSRC